MCHARRVGPRTPSTTTDTNLDCAFVENALFSFILKSQQNRIELVTRPDTDQNATNGDSSEDKQKDDPRESNEKREKILEKPDDITFFTGVPLTTMPGHTGYLTFASLPAVL